jgi:hypothetical protein
MYGRPSIFKDETPAQQRVRVTGRLTAAGWRGFEKARGILARLANWPTEDVSDAETIDYLARHCESPGETERYISARRRP